MARTDTQVNVRMPEWLLKRLRKAAAHSNSSLTAEIVSRLSNSFADPLGDLLRTRRIELAQLESSLNAYEWLLDGIKRGSVQMTSEETGAIANEVRQHRMAYQIVKNDISVVLKGSEQLGMPRSEHGLQRAEPERETT